MIMLSIKISKKNRDIIKTIDMKKCHYSSRG